MVHDVFISYAHQDKEVANAVCRFLEERDIKCWIAPRNVAGGTQYPEEISNAISSSKAIVLIFSARANSSPHVVSELDIAFNERLPIIPFRIENITPTGSTRYYLAGRNWLDAWPLPLEPHLDRLLASVSSFMPPPQEDDDSTWVMEAPAGADSSLVLPAPVSSPIELHHLGMEEGPDFTKGAILNEFVLLEELGRGSSGRVWLAENQVAVGNEPKVVVLKIPRLQESSILSEARNLTLLEHPRFPKFYRAGRTNDGLIFLVMEYITGRSLWSRLREEGRIPEEEALAITVQVLKGLEFLHAEGYIHRDIKPHNILIDAQGTARLADFGLAEKVGTLSSTTIVGTPGYMAPEVWAGQTCCQSDLWSVGVLLHVMLTEKLPFSRPLAELPVNEIVHEPVSLDAELGNPLREILTRSLAREPLNRFADAAAMLMELELIRHHVNWEGAWQKKYDIGSAPDTVLIVVGKGYTVEIDDRPGAQFLQAEILKSGQMALILTADEYLERGELFRLHPVIAVGGPLGNKLTHELNELLEVDEGFYSNKGNYIQKVAPGPPARAVAWGAWAKDTMQAVVELLEQNLAVFQPPMDAITRYIISPHINDAFLSLNGALPAWQRAGHKIKIIDVFSNTNYSSFYVTPPWGQPAATVSDFRKIEELANARLTGIPLSFLDFPEVFIREGFLSFDDLNKIWGEDNVAWDKERKLMDEIIKALPLDANAAYFFPLGVSNHVDHLIIRRLGVELLKHKVIHDVYFFEDLWPLPPKEIADYDIGEVPVSIQAIFDEFNVRLEPQWAEVDFKEAMDLIGMYYSETKDMKNMMLGIGNYLRNRRDGRYLVRFWQRK
jgi:serine/threonine protein kinase